VDIRARLFRQYPHGDVASHVLGYIGRVTTRDQERLEELGDAANYRGTDYIGKSGIESSYSRNCTAPPASSAWRSTPRVAASARCRVPRRRRATTSA